MAESTLSGAYSDYREEIAFYLGYGRTSGNWTTAQTDTIASILKSALRQFYHPPKLPDSVTAHDWSFLHPVTTLTVGSTTGTMVGVPVYTTTSALTASTAVFNSRMVLAGTTVQFTTSGTSYTIAGFTSTTAVTLTGDASGETSGDTFTISAQYEYDLEDDFGGIDGGFTYTTSNLYDTIRICSEKQIRDLRQGINTTGHMRWAAIRPKTTTGSAGQRFEVLFYPTPDSSYTLQYSYTPLLYVLSDSLPYPWGGEPHTETILASCLAVAEERLEDTRGEKYTRFLERLRASIEWDERATVAETLGYNSDQSRDADAHRLYRDNNLVTVTV